MKVKLTAWAASQYDPPPSIRTLRTWAKTGQIYPAPELVGREYMVEKNAVRLPPMPAGASPEAANEGKMSNRALAILHAA